MSWTAMTSLFNPWVWLGLLLALSGAFFTGHRSGYNKAVDEQRIEVARLNGIAREVERDMNGKVNDLSAKLVKANEDVKAEISKRRSAIASGSLRLSVPVSGLQSCPGATPASGDLPQARAELEPAFAQSLVDITDSGDQAIRQLNACIDAYNTVYEALKGSHEPE